MPIYNLMLRQRLKTNYDTNIIAIGSKSTATYNVISNNVREFTKLFEGNLIFVTY